MSRAAPSACRSPGWRRRRPRWGSRLLYNGVVPEDGPMPTLQIELTDGEYEQLREWARARNQREDELARDQLRDWLAGHKDRFRAALGSVLAENQELYRRLA